MERREGEMRRREEQSLQSSFLTTHSTKISFELMFPRCIFESSSKQSGFVRLVFLENGKRHVNLSDPPLHERTL